MNLIITFYENQYTSADKGETYELPWDELRTDILERPEIAPAKGSETQYFPGKIKPISKGDASVEFISMLCLDFDNVTEAQVESIYKRIREEGWEAFVHSTYSHSAQLKKNGLYRIRVILPMSKPVVPGRFRLLWSNIYLLFDKLPDRTTSSPSKHFLAPSQPPGPEAEKVRIAKHFQGTFLDPDAVISRFRVEVLAEAEVSLELGSEKITPTMFRPLCDRKLKGDEKLAQDAIKKALEGERYAPEGSREAMLFAMAGLLAKEFPKGNPDDICNPLKNSIVKEERDANGPAFVDFRDKVIRRQRDVIHRAAVARVQQAKEEADAALVREQAEYTPERLEAYLNRINNRITVEQLSRALVLVHKNGFFVFDGTSYTYASTLSLLATIRSNLLHRAETYLGFSYFFPSGNGKPPEPKTPDAFVRDHGGVVKEIRYNYSGVSYFDPEKEILHLSQTESIQKTIPERCEKVDRWMKEFCGSDEEGLSRWKQWMAQVSNTNLPLAGLVLLGPTGIGKSAFVEGISKLFGNSPPCSMRNYFSSFNSEVLASPVVFADEAIPEINGKVPTEGLRSFISIGHHEVNQKGLPIVILDGHIRAVMALQNAKKFDFGRGHSREDIQAIGKRFLFINGRKESAKFFDYEDFVLNGAIARHARYLASIIQRTDNRFGVDTGSREAVIAGDPVAMCVLDWIFDYLSSRLLKAAEVVPPMKQVPVFVNKGQVYVNVPESRKCWELYTTMKHKHPPKQQDLVEAVRALSPDAEPHRIRIGDRKDSFWRIQPEVFRSRLINLELCSDEYFNILMNAPHELNFRTKEFELTDFEKRKRTEVLKQLSPMTKENAFK